MVGWWSTACVAVGATIMLGAGVYGALVLQSLLDEVGKETAAAQFEGTSFAMSTSLTSSLADALAGFNGIHAAMRVRGRTFLQ